MCALCETRRNRIQVIKFQIENFQCSRFTSFDATWWLKISQLGNRPSVVWASSPPPIFSPTILLLYKLFIRWRVLLFYLAEQRHTVQCSLITFLCLESKPSLTESVSFRRSLFTAYGIHTMDCMEFGLTMFALNFIHRFFYNFPNYSLGSDETQQRSGRPNVFAAGHSPELPFTILIRTRHSEKLLAVFIHKFLARKRHLIFLKFLNTQEFTYTAQPSPNVAGQESTGQLCSPKCAAFTLKSSTLFSYWSSAKLNQQQQYYHSVACVPVNDSTKSLSGRWQVLRIERAAQTTQT